MGFWSKLFSSASAKMFKASREGDLERVKTLLKGNSNLVVSKDDLGVTPLHTAAFWGHRDVVKSLLAHGAEANAKDKQGRTPLHWAVSQGHKEVAELLRQHGGHE
jgi:ankyrin repeat protein